MIALQLCNTKLLQLPITIKILNKISINKLNANNNNDIIICI